MQRTSWYDSQLVFADGLTWMQNGIQDHIRWNVYDLFDPGVCDGMTVFAGAGSGYTNTVFVGSGTAYDRDGERIEVSTMQGPLNYKGLSINNSAGTYYVMAGYRESNDGIVGIDQDGITWAEHIKDSFLIDIYKSGTDTLPTDDIYLGEVVVPLANAPVIVTTNSREVMSLVNGISGTGIGIDEVKSGNIDEADGTTGQDTSIGSGIKTGHIQDDAITPAKLDDDGEFTIHSLTTTDGITSASLKTTIGTITTANITTANITTGNITVGNINTGTITLGLTANAITSTYLEATTANISTSNVGTETVTLGLTANAITTSYLASSGTLTTDGVSHIYLRPSNDTDDYIRFSTDGNIPSIVGEGSYLRIGETTKSNRSLSSGNDLYIAGQIEVDGVAFFDSDVNFYDSVFFKDTNVGVEFANNIPLRFGTGGGSGTSAALLMWDLSLDNTFKIGLGNGAFQGTHNLIIHSRGNNANFTAPSVTDPHLRIQSSDATSVNDYIQFWHDQTNGNIDVGSGSLVMKLAGLPGATLSGTVPKLTVDGITSTQNIFTTGTVTCNGLTFLGSFGGTLLTRTDNSGDYELFFADPQGHAVQMTLDGAVPGGAGTVKVSADDTTADYLGTKIVAGEGIDTTETAGGNETLTISGEDATTANKGIASFNSANFAVAGGDVTIKTGGVTSTELADDITVNNLTVNGLTFLDGGLFGGSVEPKSDGADKELFFYDPQGHNVQITKDGAVNVSSGAKIAMYMTAGAAILPNSNFAQLTKVSGVSWIFYTAGFDKDTDEFCYFYKSIPDGYAGGSLKITLYGRCNATSGTALMNAFLRSPNHDEVWDSGTTPSATNISIDCLAAGTAYDLMVDTGIWSSPVASDCLQIKIWRDADNVADDLAVDYELLAVMIEEV